MNELNRLTEQHCTRIVDHGSDDMIGQPGLPGPVVEDLSADVIKVGVVDADDRPDVWEEALAVVDTAVRDDAREIS